MDGQDIRDVSLSSLRESIGIVSQDTLLFSGTVRDNIAYGNPEASREQVIEAARAAHIHDLIASLPDGYEAMLQNSKEFAELGIPFIFKSSYDKANRSSGTSFRGPGIDADEGLGERPADEGPVFPRGTGHMDPERLDDEAGHDDPQKEQCQTRMRKRSADQRRLLARLRSLVQKEGA